MLLRYFTHFEHMFNTERQQKETCLAKSMLAARQLRFIYFTEKVLPRTKCTIKSL